MITNNMYLCGLDEAGRGALAGPLVAAAVTIKNPYPDWLVNSKYKIIDGKLLKPNQWFVIYKWLRRHKIIINIEIISTRSINNHGIGWANREIFRRLIKKVEAHEYIVDGKLRIGRIQGKSAKVHSVIDADATILPVILAGIVAKIERDRIMSELHKFYPQFNWIQNAGYGTEEHIKALQLNKLTRYHRTIFVTTAMKNKIQSPLFIREG